MFSLGILALISATFIPGLALFGWTERRLPFGPQLFAVFFFSLAWTYIKTMTLVALGLFIQPIVLGIFAAECLCLLFSWYYRNSPAHTIKHEPRTIGLKVIFSATTAFILLAISVRFVLVATHLGPRPFWSVWTHWDSVVSWNRWALNMAGGSLPTGTWGYGQMIPALWAYTYQFIGTTKIEIFAKILTDMWVFTIVLMQIDLIFRKGILAGLLGWLGLAFFAHTPPSMWVFQSMADMPLAAAIFASVYFALVADTLPESGATVAWLASIMLTGLAAATKQQGMMLVVLGPLLYWRFLPRPNKHRSFALAGWISALAFGLFWYLYFLKTCFTGRDFSNLSFLLSFTGNTEGTHTLFGRLSQATAMWVGFFGPWVVYLLLPLIIIAALAFVPRLRPFIFLFLVPYFFIWAFGFSYDIRNALLIFPLLCLLLGLGLQGIADRYIGGPFVGSLSAFFQFDRFRNFQISAPRCSLNQSQLSVLLVLLICGATGLGLLISDRRLVLIQADMALNKGSRVINARLQELRDVENFHAVVATNYEILCYLNSFDGWRPMFRFFRDENEVFDVARASNINAFVISKSNGGPNLKALYRLTEAGFSIVEDSQDLLILKRGNQR